MEGAREATAPFALPPLLECGNAMGEGSFLAVP